MAKVPRNLQRCRSLGRILGLAVSAGGGRPYSEAPNPERLTRPPPNRRAPPSAAPASAAEKAQPAGGPTWTRPRPSAAGFREAPQAGEGRPAQERCGASGVSPPSWEWPRLSLPAPAPRANVRKPGRREALVALERAESSAQAGVGRSFDSTDNPEPRVGVPAGAP